MVDKPSGSGHAGHVDPENIGAGADAWIWYRHAYRADQ